MNDLHLEQYSGAWSIHEPTMRQVLSNLSQIDLHAHIEAQRRRDDDDDDSMVTKLPSGVAVLDVRGTMTKYGSSLFNRAGTVRMRKAVRDLLNDDGNKALVVRIDSGGGSVAGTAELAADLRRYAQRKKLTAYIDDVGASAAYWIASQADRIVAGSTAVVGSIGVVTWVTDTSKMMADRGIKVDVIRSGPLKLIGAVPGDPFTEEQRESIQAEIDATTERFVRDIASGRGMSVKAVRKLATGEVWVGSDAVDVGLVDAVGGIDDVIGEVEALIGVKQGASGDLGVLFATDDRGALDGFVGIVEADDDSSADDDVAADAVEDDMSATDKDKSSGPQPATLAELKAAMPTAGSDFLLGCMEKGATLTAAVAEFAKAQSEALAKREAELKAAQEELEGLKLVGSGSAVAPLGGVSNDADAKLDTAEAFKAEVLRIEANGKSRQEAMRLAAARAPAAHKAYMDLCVQTAQDCRKFGANNRTHPERIEKMRALRIG